MPSLLAHMPLGIVHPYRSIFSIMYSYIYMECIFVFFCVQFLYWIANFNIIYPSFLSFVSVSICLFSFLSVTLFFLPCFSLCLQRLLLCCLFAFVILNLVLRISLGLGITDTAEYVIRYIIRYSVRLVVGYIIRYTNRYIIIYTIR